MVATPRNDSGVILYALYFWVAHLFMRSDTTTGSRLFRAHTTAKGLTEDLIGQPYYY
jgi:hypothetical protein